MWWNFSTVFSGVHPTSLIYEQILNSTLQKKKTTKKQNLRQAHRFWRCLPCKRSLSCTHWYRVGLNPRMKAPDNTYHSGRYTKVQYAGKTGLPTSTNIPEWRHLTTLTILGDTPRCNMPAKQACQPVLTFQNEGTWQHLPFWEIHQGAICRQNRPANQY